MDKDNYKKAYRQHKSNSTRRGIPFKLSFDEWFCIWIDSGHLCNRGRGADRHCMSRMGDKGSYEVGNVFIQLGKDNVRDGNVGKPDTPETRQRKSIAMKGKTRACCRGDKNPMHRPDVKAKMSLAIGGKNHYKAIGVTTPAGFFHTAKLAAEALNINKSTVEWRAANNKFGFSKGANI